MGSKIRNDLEGTTHVYGPDGDTLVLRAGDRVPDGYPVGDHLLDASSEDDAEKQAAKAAEKAAKKAAKASDAPKAAKPVETPPAPETPAASDGQPPRNGRGSGRDAWAAHAGTVDVVIEDDWSRDDIIAAVDAAAAAS